MSPTAQFWILQTALPASGLLLLITGLRIGEPRLCDAGVFALALSAVTTGIASIAWRRVVVLRRELSFGFKLVVYEGVAARLAGIALIALGVAVASLGAAHAAGTSAAAIRSSMIARPGLALGAWELLAPQAFDGLVESFRRAGSP